MFNSFVEFLLTLVFYILAGKTIKNKQQKLYNQDYNMNV